jgi:prolipoprotein diacylglyceryltransferase
MVETKAVTARNRGRFVFYGGLLAFLILLYGYAEVSQFRNPHGRPFEAATDIALPVLVLAFLVRILVSRRKSSR